MKRWGGLAAFLLAGFWATGALVIGDGKAVLTVEPVVVSVEAHLPSIGWLPSLFPGRAPVAVKGFRFLIVEETEDRAKLTEPQRQILFSPDIRSYAAGHCAKGPDGKTPEFRIFDKDADLSHESDVWRQFMAVKREATPWLVVSNGSSGFSGPLPATAADTLAILKKYGGQ